ncbi:MAG: hypothetical protein IPL45_10945 [Actinomycetales bacterium]|nr:hypothetical protein [Actinomycetales bacterium]
MQSSSLIFVVIIAIWAAFLLQHWVRRREHVAMAQSIDRFSEAIRVLDRRPVRPSPAGRPAFQTYAALVSPFAARRAGGPPVAAPVAGRQTVRATRPATASPTIPKVAIDMTARTDGRSSAAPVAHARPTTKRPHVGLGRPAAAAPAAKGARGRLLVRWARGLGLLASLLSIPVVSALALLGAVPEWAVLVSLSASAGGIVSLRYAAVRERARRSLDASMSRSTRPGRVATDRASASPARPSPAHGVAAPGVAAPGVAAHARPAHAGPAKAGPIHADPISTDLAAAASDGVGEAPVPTSAHTASVETGSGETAIGETGSGETSGDGSSSRRAAYRGVASDGTWVPVPVPPPTYTLKGRVDRPAPEAAEATATPSAAERRRPVGEQRRAVGS